MLQVTVNSYDDIISPQGECVTMYAIQVQYSNRSAYSLAKRYSDFSNLYQAVKDIVPYEYKFPNKSMFNNAAQFTKDRRRKGFDELLKLLARYDPIPEELQVFLELRQRLNGDTSKAALINPTAHSKGKAAPMSSVSGKSEQDREEAKQKDELATRKKLLLLSNHLLKYRQVSQPTPEAEVDVYREIHKIFPSILRSSVLTAVLVYFALIVLSIVDVSRSSYIRIAMTALSMVAIACLVQIRDAKKSMLHTHSEHHEVSRPSPARSSLPRNGLGK